MNEKTDAESQETHPLTAGIDQTLHDKVEKWRSKLLDIGNRNPLVSCSFNPSRGVIEIVTPDSERVWRSLAADSEAGADPMRFPWRRELVPPPAGEGWEQHVRRPRFQQVRCARWGAFPSRVSFL